MAEVQKPMPVEGSGAGAGAGGQDASEPSSSSNVAPQRVGTGRKLKYIVIDSGAVIGQARLENQADVRPSSLLLLVNRNSLVICGLCRNTLV